MCCLFATLVLFGPRLGIIVWGLAQPTRWEAAFSTFIWPLLGFVFLPWTTLMYVSVYPGGVEGFDWVWMVLAVFIDIVSYSGSAYGNRDKIRAYGTPTPA
ncbi:MAG TPA: hypothetical protein VI980_07730 [Acidimicrobiia bacterium]|nr:hypothetical protein [Acidimicrobiia bacterium]